MKSEYVSVPRDELTIEMVIEAFRTALCVSFILPGNRKIWTGDIAELLQDILSRATPSAVADDGSFAAHAAMCGAKIGPQKPSAPRVVSDEDVQRAKDAYEEARSKGTFHEAMRAAIESLPSVMVTDGWKLVPVEPTEGMAEDGEAVVDEVLRAEWLAAGGSVHGPNVETVTMPEADYFRFRRTLASITQPPRAQEAGEDARDAARYRWLTTDHADTETRKKCRDILDRMSVMSYSAASSAIDATLSAQRWNNDHENP